MATDGEESLARSETWRGALPAVFELAADEVTTLQRPRPYCVCLPRQSLLPLAADSVRRHFEPFGPPMGGNLWFEHAGTPLRWQLPIGVLYDLTCGEEAATRHDLPWRITVHFASFPVEQLLRATVREAESVLMHGLKEACFLRCGSATPANSLLPATQQALLAALSDTADPDVAYAGYQGVSEQIEEAVKSHVDKARHADRLGIPFRACVSTTEWRQQPMPSTNHSTGEPTTLRDALTLLLPTLFESGGEKSEDGEGGGSEGGSGDAASSSAAASPGTAPLVLVQGVRVPLSTPLSWLWSACSHPDGWLYACVRVPLSVDPAPAADSKPVDAGATPQAKQQADHETATPSPTAAAPAH